MMAAVPRWYDAIVEEDVVALSQDVEIVIDLWEDHTELGFGFLQLMAAMLLSLRIPARRGKAGSAYPFDARKREPQAPPRH